MGIDPNVADQDGDEEENFDEVEEESTEEEVEDSKIDEDASDDTYQEEEEEEKEETLVKRPVKYMPLDKFNKQKAKWEDKNSELESKVAELSKVKDSDVTDDIKKLAEEYGTEPGFVKKVIDIASRRNKIPQELLDNLQATQEKTMFDREYESVVKKYPEFDTPEKKAQLKESAYTEALHKTPLSIIAKGMLYDEKINPGKNTAESTTGGTKNSKKIVDFDSVSTKDLKGMSNETFEKYSNYLAEKEQESL